MSSSPANSVRRHPEHRLPNETLLGTEALLGRLRVHNVFARYALAIGAVVAALALRLLLTPATGKGAPFVIFFGATLITSLLAGAGPAFLCLAFSLPLSVLLFVLPQGYPIHQAVFQGLLYAADGLIIVALTTFVRRWQVRVEIANRGLQEAMADRERALARTSETIELAPDAYFVADLSARFSDVNQAACRLLGYDRQELVGMRIYDLIRAEDAARLEQEKAALLVPGAVLTNEWALRRKGGTFVPVEISANILGDGRWQAFARDITERRRITEERERALAREHDAREHAELVNAQLRESEERFRLTIDEAPIGMALVALDGRFARVNHALCELTGYTRAELERLTFQDITHPDDLATDVELARQLAAGDIPSYQLEKRYIRKDGSVVEIMLSGSVLRGADQTPRYFIAQIEDISTRKRAERALRQSEAKFSGIVSISADAIICVDEEQRITIFNDGAEQIFGYAQEDVLGTPLERLIPERFRERHRDHFARFAAGAENARRMGARHDIFGLRKGGDEFPAEASIARIVVEGTTLFSVVLRDITDRKRVEEALQRAVVARDEVLGIVAHDLRNPLNTILMTASLLENAAPEPERRDQTPRKVIERAAKRMNRLIQDMLDVTLAEAGELRLERAPISTRDLVREALLAQAPLASASHVTLHSEVADDVPDVDADRHRLLQVFENLIGNAIKFTPPGGRITVSAAPDDSDVRFAVSDTGAGIPAESMPHVFDRFWQGQAKERRRGAGLGLPITQAIVTAHGGTIRVESILGQGSTFTFTIPSVPSRSSRMLEPKEVGRRPTRRVRG